MVGEVDFNSSGRSGGDLYGREDEVAATQRGNEVRGNDTNVNDVNETYADRKPAAGSLRQMTPQQVKAYEAKAQKEGLIYNKTWKNY